MRPRPPPCCPVRASRRIRANRRCHPAPTHWTAGASLALVRPRAVACSSSSSSPRLSRPRLSRPSLPRHGRPMACLDPSSCPTFALSAHEIAALEDAAGAQAVAATLPRKWVVVDGDERTDVSAEWLIVSVTDAPAQPDRWRATRTVIVRRLTSLGDEVESAGDAGRAQARAQARTDIETILAQSEFQQSAASKWRSRLQERVGKWFEDVMGWFGGGRGAGRTTALILAWAAALAALIGLGFWTARIISDRPRGASLDLGTSAAMRPRARELALRAVAAARAGETREAVRCAYGAALVRLEEQGVWRVDARSDAARVLAAPRGERRAPFRRPRPDAAIRADLVRQPRRGSRRCAPSDRSSGGSRMPASWRTTRSDGARRRGRGHRAPHGRLVPGGSARLAAAQRRVELRRPSRWRPGCLPAIEGARLRRRTVVRACGRHPSCTGAHDARAGEPIRRSVRAGRQGCCARSSKTEDASSRRAPRRPAPSCPACRYLVPRPAARRIHG